LGITQPDRPGLIQVESVGNGQVATASCSAVEWSTFSGPTYFSFSLHIGPVRAV